MAPAPRWPCLPLLGRLVLAALACLPPLSGERLRRSWFLPRALPAGRPADGLLARSAGRPQPRCFSLRPRGDPSRPRPLIALRRSAGGCGRGGHKFKPGSSGLRFGALSVLWRRADPERLLCRRFLGCHVGGPGERIHEDRSGQAWGPHGNRLKQVSGKRLPLVRRVPQPAASGEASCRRETCWRDSPALL